MAQVEEEDVGMVVLEFVSGVQEFGEFGVAGSEEEDCWFGHFGCARGYKYSSSRESVFMVEEEVWYDFI